MNSTATVPISSQASLRVFLRSDAAEVLRAAGDAVPASVGMLFGEGLTAAQAAVESAGNEEFAAWFQTLSRRGWLCVTAEFNDHKLATFVPTAKGIVFNSKYRLGTGPHILSRFACLHREGPDWVLESPLTSSKVLLHHPAAISLLGVFAKPTVPSEGSRTLAVLPNEASDILLTILANSGVLVECDADGNGQEPASQSNWEFFDLLFHSRSRLGRHAYPYGARSDYAPSFASDVESPVGIELFTPNIEQLKAEDPPFSSVLETRRSIRNHGSVAITSRQLGEFLYRCARIQGDGHRPYPSAGACYEMELYIGVHRCEGLPAGLYQYHPRSHRLEAVSEMTNAVGDLFSQAAIATAGSATPQILIVLAARMENLQKKYNSLSYALALKNAGVLLQTMSLTASVLGLAGCPLGGGDSDLFAQAAKRDYYAEASVGEFILGTLPDFEEGP